MISAPHIDQRHHFRSSLVGFSGARVMQLATPVRLLLPVLCVGTLIVSAVGITSAQQAARPTVAAKASGLPRSTPEAQGISSAAILQFIEAAEEKLDALHSIMIVRHGHVVTEGWWAPYAANEPHMLYSLSKSFTSTAVGLAVAQGKLTVDDPVLKFFPDEAPAEPSANLKAMRVRDLLSMSTGHHEDVIRDFPYRDPDSVVRKFLSLPVAHKPGTLFVYNTPATYMLSAIVQKLTGQTVLDYLRPRLFEPLGISNPQWEASPQGISMGGFGLSVRTEDIARFGQLYLRKGEWQKQQLVPAAWVEEATARHASNGSSPTSDWEQGYGYQFWRSRHGYRGDGAHGQFCLVLPQYDAVVVFTSGTRDLPSVPNLTWERLLPALKPAALPADPAAHKKLTAKLATLTLRPQTMKGTSAASTTVAKAAATSGTRYVFASNPQSIESIALDSAEPNGRVTLTMRVAGADQKIDASPDAWTKQTITLRGVPDPIATSGAWSADDTYKLSIVRYQTPFTTNYTLRFAADQLTLDIEPNVGPATERKTQLIGKPATSTSAQP
jgi:CubicO group peptidase (beta-lactamase class C family)